jgi:hypothetical protein
VGDIEAVEELDPLVLPVTVNEENAALAAEERPMRD